jgi:hypothetical protein
LGRGSTPSYTAASSPRTTRLTSSKPRARRCAQHNPTPRARRPRLIFLHPCRTPSFLSLRELGSKHPPFLTLPSLLIISQWSPALDVEEMVRAGTLVFLDTRIKGVRDEPPPPPAAAAAALPSPSHASCTPTTTATITKKKGKVGEIPPAAPEPSTLSGTETEFSRVVDNASHSSGGCGGGAGGSGGAGGRSAAAAAAAAAAARGLGDRGRGQAPPPSPRLPTPKRAAPPQPVGFVQLASNPAHP